MKYFIHVKYFVCMPQQQTSAQYQKKKCQKNKRKINKLSGTIFTSFVGGMKVISCINKIIAFQKVLLKVHPRELAYRFIGIQKTCCINQSIINVNQLKPITRKVAEYL